MATLVISRVASADQADILQDIGQAAGANVAETYQDRFTQLFSILVVQPEIGAPRPELGRAVRLCLVQPYNVYYRFDRARDEVRILRILHGRRDITRGMMTP
ncbi:MAG TPA: type II toxin-antitoxin system RelE/ParE family toxin [Alphaproteobacteria bacterium]|nr:type II toxin-antitoxin system RelE/ParE family toxin [Alphaproteobacteria bacterium]HAJ45429.1 type II toxin-antitoxin system RelE/ParE family toxin [Alphaproteobacteria bacterium]HBK55643.1 type II toxin-antitoxin system RelE/ParE family toxin [Xanthomonadales bacterium]